MASCTGSQLLGQRWTRNGVVATSCRRSRWRFERRCVWCATGICCASSAMAGRPGSGAIFVGTYSCRGRTSTVWLSSGCQVTMSRTRRAAALFRLAAASNGAVSTWATMLPGGVSGASGCGRVGAVRLAATSSSADLAKLSRVEGLADGREQLALLFLDVVADVLDQHRHLGPVALMAGIHCLELGECQLDEVMLLERLEHVVASVRNEAPRGRVEDLLFDRGVDGQGFGDALYEVLAPLVGTITRLLEADEQLLDLAVVIGEHPNGIELLAGVASGRRAGFPGRRALRLAGGPSHRLRRLLGRSGRLLRALLRGRLAAALLPADLRAAPEGVRDVLCDVVGDFFVGAMG